MSQLPWTGKPLGGQIALWPLYGMAGQEEGAGEGNERERLPEREKDIFSLKQGERETESQRERERERQSERQRQTQGWRERQRQRDIHWEEERRQKRRDKGKKVSKRYRNGRKREEVGEDRVTLRVLRSDPDPGTHCGSRPWRTWGSWSRR